jgi:hypothetical protein
MDSPRSHNGPVTPKKLITDSVYHNDYANRSTERYEKHLNDTVRALTLCKDLADFVYANGFVNETAMSLCVEDFRFSMRNWVYIKSLFYYEIVDRPKRILQERLESFEIMCNDFQLMFQNINQSLYSIRTENTEFGASILKPIENMNHILERYLNESATKLEVSEVFLSNTTESILAKFQLYFQLLKTRQTTLTDSVTQLHYNARDIWESIIMDEDSWNYYNFVNKSEYSRNISEVEVELNASFTMVIDAVTFSDVIGGSDAQLLSTFDSMGDHMREFKKSLRIDSSFIR